jgi:hypothetical protein
MKKNYLDLLGEVEGYDYLAKISWLVSELDNQGFSHIVKECEKGSRGNKNVYYYSDSCEYALCLIYNEPKVNDFFKENHDNLSAKELDALQKDLVRFTIIDRDVLDKEITENKLMLNTAKRCAKTNGYKLVYKDGGKLKSLHHLITGFFDSLLQVDHKYHCVAINTREALRICTGTQNCQNRKMYCKVHHSRFWFECSALCLNGKPIPEGFKLVGDTIRSGKYKDEASMRKALEDFETTYLGEYRYNPLEDYSDTWYAYIAQRMLGVISQDELEDYNRQYMIANHPDVADYYNLAPLPKVA